MFVQIVGASGPYKDKSRKWCIIDHKYVFLLEKISRGGCMASHWRYFSILVSVVLLFFSLCSCGSSSTSSKPVVPAQPTGLVVTATGTNQVGLSWPNAADAPSYNIYYSTSSGVKKSNGIKFASTPCKSAIITGLDRKTNYYFVITAASSGGESGESNEVSTATLASPVPFSQNDLEGTWNFNILFSGNSQGWMRGKLTISNFNSPGEVTQVNEFQDSSNDTSPQAGFFNSLILDSGTGQVHDGSFTLNGFIAGNLYRDLVVLTSPPLGPPPVGGTGSPMIVILQKQVPNITFDPVRDLQGQLGGGPGFSERSFIYNQLTLDTAGVFTGWEFALGRINSHKSIEYSISSADNRSNIFTNWNFRKSVSDNASFVTITSDGIFTESLQPGVPSAAVPIIPTVVIDRGVMSADKTLIVGTATDNSGASPKYVLRIYQIVNINIVTDLTDPLSQSHTFSQADLAGTYNFVNALPGRYTKPTGSISIDSSGVVSPDGITLLMDVSPDPGTGIILDPRDGVISSTTNIYYHGKLSYYSDIIVSTRTDLGNGTSLNLFIGLR